MAHLTDRDIEQLSAYLDGELKPSESAEIEARLQVEPALKQTLAELRWMTAGLKALPVKRPPRRYRLTPEMVGQRGQPWRIPALRLATAVLTLALVTVIGIDFLGSASRLSIAGAPQALEAPAIAQDSLQAEQGMTDKTEENTQPSFAAQSGAAEGTPAPNALRAAGPTPEAGQSSAESTPPMALAVPEAAGSDSGVQLTPSPEPPQPPAETALPSKSAPAVSRQVVLRWSELLLGACLIFVLVAQFRARR